MGVAWYLDLATGEITESHRDAVSLYNQGHEIALLNSRMEQMTYWAVGNDGFDFDL